MGQRLLHVGVQAELHRRHGDGCVHVIGGADVDRIEVAAFLVQQNAPVLIGGDLSSASEFLDRRESARIHVRDARDLHVGMAGNAAEIARPHAADSKAGMADASIGGLGHQIADEERRGDAGRRGLFQECSPASKRHFGPLAHVSVTSVKQAPCRQLYNLQGGSHIGALSRKR